MYGPVKGALEPTTTVPTVPVPVGDCVTGVEAVPLVTVVYGPVKGAFEPTTTVPTVAVPVGVCVAVVVAVPDVTVVYGPVKGLLVEEVVAELVELELEGGY